MSLFDELKRRNVARMAALYIVASWLVLQVADYLFDALELPSAWDRLVLALVILGFPIVLIFSWVFEMTPEGLKRESEIDRSQSVTQQTGRKINVAIVALLVLAILAVGADRLMPEATQTQGKQDDSLQVSTDVIAPKYSIAVLPFRNRSARDDDVYFVDGIHDDIVTQLAHIGSLTVTSRTSVERFRDVSQQSIREIGALLGVRNILEGGVQRSGDRIRINVQLIDVTSDGHLWAETFDRELTASNLFAVQGEIATAVAEALRAALLDEEKLVLNEQPTESLKAYDLYLLGRFHWNKRTEESIQLARDYFEQAIEEDPNYVLALSGLADSYALLVDYGNLDGATAYPIAQETIDKAMELDDSVSEVWASLGLMRRTQRDFEGAEEALLRAIELDPGNFSAWLWYAQTINFMRRHEEALQAMGTAYSLEPMSKPINSLLANQYFQRGDFVRARQHYERSALLDEEQAVFFQNQIADMYFYEGDHTRAITQYRRVLKDAPGNDVALDGVAWSFLALGDILEARRWFSRAEAQFAYGRSMYWVFEAEEDYAGAIVYLEDKLRFDRDRRSLNTLRLLFRASYLGNDIQLARAYVDELLENLNDRFEINPSDTEPMFNLLSATFLIQHDNADGLDAERGRKMLAEIHSGLVSLREQGYHRPMTLAGLAIAYALKGDSLAAFESMNQAIDFGYRNYQYALNQPGFDGLRDSVDFVAITDRIQKLIEDDKVRLASTVLEPYSPPAERQPIAMSREKFREYEGYYSNGNMLGHFFVADDGAFMVRVGPFAADPILAIAEDLFFMPKDSDVTLEFVADESGAVTHLLVNAVGGIFRWKAVDAPPPAVQLDRAILARYEGTFARQLFTTATEDKSETDSWSAIISVDAEGTVWFDPDNQPRLEIVPYSETEFFAPGFAVTFTFIVDPATGKVDRIEADQDGSLVTWHRQ